MYIVHLIKVKSQIFFKLSTVMYMYVQRDGVKIFLYFRGKIHSKCSFYYFQMKTDQSAQGNQFWLMVCILQ